jgi:hypothetical protein
VSGDTGGSTTLALDNDEVQKWQRVLNEERLQQATGTCGEFGDLFKAPFQAICSHLIIQFNANGILVRYANLTWLQVSKSYSM